jgi:hypothetical protein
MVCGRAPGTGAMSAKWFGGCAPLATRVRFAEKVASIWYNRTIYHRALIFRSEP